MDRDGGVADVARAEGAAGGAVWSDWAGVVWFGCARMRPGKGAMWISWCVSMGLRRRGSSLGCSFAIEDALGRRVDLVDGQGAARGVASVCGGGGDPCLMLAGSGSGGASSRI